MRTLSKMSFSIWDAFVEYLETVYFEGTAEELDKELVEFEYALYKSCYETISITAPATRGE